MAGIAAIAVSCDNSVQGVPETNPRISLDEVARILSALPVGIEQMQEVHDAVSSSSGNGYDEEYTMADLFASPGAGVGDSKTRALGHETAERSYSNPLKDMIRDYLGSSATRAAGISVEDYIRALQKSDIQIYWPYYENWEDEDTPVITFDPEDGSSANIGYRLGRDEHGERMVEEVIVDEAMAMKVPVWVVNRNDDSGYTSLEMLRRQDPDWGITGGEIIVGGRTKAPSDKLKTLILKDFTMKRNYDPWFAGASEFFVKCGAVEDFTAGTEEELKLYNPTITDFMIVVKRSDAGKPRPFNAVLVSEMTEQLTNIAFMIHEDDGGERTSWKTEAIVKVSSKSYGFTVNLPFKTEDDIVWQGQLSTKYIEKTEGETEHFGDVDLTFEIVER